MATLLQDIQTAFEDNDDELLMSYLQQAIDCGTDPLEIISMLSSSMERIGAAFAEGELFLPDMVIAGEQMQACMEILNPILHEKNESVCKIGKVVLGTVSGDVHDIGKNMVKTMLTISGFDVIDLGTDVSAAQFYTTVISEKPEIVALSSCMTTTVPSMIDTIDLFKSKGILDKVKIVVGGGSMSHTLAESFGSCTYGGENAFVAAQIMKALI